MNAYIISQGYSPYLKPTLNAFSVSCPWEWPLPVSFINPALCAPLQKPGLFCKAGESVGGHTEPVGGSPPGHCWPWLSSQRPRGDWQDPLQKLPQGPGWAGVWLQSHTSEQSVRNGQTNKSEDGGLCSWIYRLREKSQWVKTGTTKAYICEHARPVMDNTLWRCAGRSSGCLWVDGASSQHADQSQQVEVSRYLLWIYPPLF